MARRGASKPAYSRAGKKTSKEPTVTCCQKDGKSPDTINSSADDAAKRVPPSGPKGLNKGEKTDLSADEWEAQRPKGTPTKRNESFVKAEKYADGSYKVHMKHPSGDTYSVPYDKDGNPDFYSVRNETKNGELVEAVYTDSEVELTRLAHPNDYAHSYDLNTKKGRNDAKKRARDADKKKAEKAFKETPFYQWHHNGGTSMIAVDENVHQLFKHHGEFSRNAKK